MKAVHNRVFVAVLAALVAATGCGTGDNSAATGGNTTGSSGTTNSMGGNGGLGASASGGGGTPSAPTSCPTTAWPDNDVVARAATALLSCTSDDGFYRTQVYLRGAQGGYEYLGGTDFTRCLAAIDNGCAGVFECFGVSPRQGDEPCGTCQGDVAVVCEEDLLWDCSVTGSTCESGWCTPPGAPPCDAAEFMDACDAQGRPTHCEDYVRAGPECEALGLECTEEGEARCTGTGSACTADEGAYFDVRYAGTSCSGDHMNACIGGKTAELDCRCFGEDFSCQSSGGTFFCGSAGECDPRTHEKTCDGDSVVFCNAGRLTTVDCSTLGFTTCGNNSDAGCQ